jgi:hypothetical protein
MATKPDPLIQIAAALEGCAHGLHCIANSLQRLGNGDAATGGIGAIEGLSMALKEAIQDAAESVSSSLRRDEE